VTLHNRTKNVVSDTKCEDCTVGNWCCWVHCVQRLHDSVQPLSDTGEMVWSTWESSTRICTVIYTGVLIDLDERNRAREFEQILRSLCRKLRGYDSDGSLLARQFTGRVCIYRLHFTSRVCSGRCTYAFDVKTEELIITLRKFARLNVTIFFYRSTCHSAPTFTFLNRSLRACAGFNNTRSD